MKQSLTFKYSLLGLFVAAVFSFGFEDVLAAPPAPSVSPACSGTGLNINMSSPGADYYALRVDNTANGWTGVCSTARNNPGDDCGDVGPSFNHFYSSASPVSYNVWAHACSWSGGCSAPTSTGATCSPPVAPPSIFSFSSSVSSVPSTGGLVTFNWLSNASSCSTSWAGGGFPASGSSGPHWISSTNNYTLTCTNSGGSVSQTVTVTANPPTLAAPTGFTARSDIGFENALTIRWNPVPGATYYALRNDNNSDSWQYGSGPLLAACIAETTTDDALLQQGGEYNGTYAGIDACGNTTSTNVSLFVMASSYNHIWVHSCNALGCSPASEIFVTLPPSSPSGLSATCDASGNATVSWNPVPVPGGLNRHYSFRLDNQADSWQYDVNNFRTNHDACVNDTVDASGVLGRVSGSGTDYCGNMTDTTWRGVINPSGTQKVWVHTKSRNFTSFGNRPPSEITFTCSATGPPVYSCTGGPLSNATMWPNDNIGLTADTAYNYSATDTGTRCQYFCNAGSTWNGTSCAASTGGPSADLKVNNQDYYGENGLMDPVIVLAGSIVNVTWTSSNVLYCNTWFYNDDAYARGEPANSTLLSSSGISFPAPGSGSWFAQIFCNNTGNPTGGNELVYDQVYISVSSPPPPPSTLKVCQDNCNSGVGATAGIAMNIGEIRNLVACFNAATASDPGGLCGNSSGDFTTSSAWEEVAGNGTVSLLPGFTSSNKKQVRGNSNGTETITARYSGNAATMLVSVPPPACTPDCSNASNVCNTQSFPDGCSGSCTGTKVCGDYNWKEVAP